MTATKHDVESVKYIGIARVRRVLPDEWEKAGIKNQGGVEWNELNGWTLMGDEFTSDAIKVLEQDEYMILLRKGENEEDDTGS